LKEAEFVKYLQDTFSFTYGKGIGDDTSAVRINPADSQQLITKDILVEGVHFSLDYYSLEQLALKSLAVNLSDISAMGGVPQYFYLGLAFPDILPKERIYDFFKGLETGCKQWQVQLAGGDFSASPIMMVSITAIGKCKKPVYRHGANTGDLIAITGTTGESNLGLKLLQTGIKDHYFIQKHVHVNPEIKKGPILALFVNAMIDVSDGLLIDLNRILTASNKGALIDYEKIPVSTELKTICKEKNWNEYETVLAGGEDYVLLFTLSPDQETRLQKEGIGYHIIGEVTYGTGITVKDQGKPITVDHFGYDHFH
jgi:thiamine-monophosphate kinase